MVSLVMYEPLMTCACESDRVLNPPVPVIVHPPAGGFVTAYENVTDVGVFFCTRVGLVVNEPALIEGVLGTHVEPLYVSPFRMHAPGLGLGVWQPEGIGGVVMPRISVQASIGVNVTP
jgi:hypothetical protein